MIVDKEDEGGIFIVKEWTIGVKPEFSSKPSPEDSFPISGIGSKEGQSDGFNFYRRMSKD